MLKNLRVPSPAFTVALVALFVALSGTAVAAGVVPLAKRALVADNAKKLGGKTRSQVAATPGPASSIAGLVSVRSAPWSLAADGASDFSVSCSAGEKALAGGYDNPVGTALAIDTRPASDDSGWKLFLGNLSSTAAASGTLYAVCAK
jgi:hypothetical protein